MAKHEKMTEEELAALCDAERGDAFALTSEIQTERSQALDYYNQEPFGNEEDGLSKYVSSDVRDAVEWIMPQLVDVFVGGDTPIIFEPENEDDVADADTESRYSQYVLERQNAGVIIVATWLKDALLQKNGIVKCFWEKKVGREREEYDGKTSAEWLALKDDDEFEIEECTIRLDEREYSEEEYARILQALPSQGQAIDEAAEYHIIGYRKKTVSQIKIENVPPEQFYVQKNHNMIFLRGARYQGEWYEKTRSELMEMGYDKELVDMLPVSNGIASMGSMETQTRKKKEGGVTMSQNSAGADRSRDLIMINDDYIRADFNGDGFAELRLVRKVGAGGAFVLENAEVDAPPYHAITPYINAYKFFGRSVADNLMDLQRAKSQLWRNAYDNVAYSAIPRNSVKGNVDTAALMTYVQGGIVKMGPDGEINPLITPFVADKAIEMADRVDMIRAERSGFSKDTMGLNPDALANSTNPVGMMIMAQSQLLTKMMATIIAHSGFKTLMENIRELVLKYEKKGNIYDLTGKFITTDIRKWRKERSAIPRVGIGFAGKQEEMAMLGNLMSLQEKFILAQGGAIEGPLTNAKGIYATTQRYCRVMGIKDTQTYFQDPSKYQPPQPKPSLAEQTLAAQVENMGNQQTIQEAKVAMEAANQHSDHEMKVAELAQKERLAMAQIASTERIAQQELLYKYGKDAKDHHMEAFAHPEPKPLKDEESPEDKVAAVVDKVSGQRKKDKEQSDKRHQSLKDAHDQTKDTVKELAKSMKEGLGDLAKAHRESNKEVVAALTRKKKVKRGADGKVEEIE